MRELTKEDIAHCLFLAQIAAGIYIANGPVQRYLEQEYFVLRPSLYFINGRPESQLYQHIARVHGDWAVEYRLSPEFNGRPGYESIKYLKLDEKGC